MSRKKMYTKIAVLELFKEHYKQTGLAYGKYNDYIPDNVIDKLKEDYQSLFRGKKWRAVHLALYKNNVKGTNDNSRTLATENNLSVPTRYGGRKNDEALERIISASSSASYRRIVFQQRNVDEALLEYAKNNNGAAPLSNSGIVEKCSIADGSLTWADIAEAFFAGRVNGASSRTSPVTMQAYAMNELRLITIHNQRKPAQQRTLQKQYANKKVFPPSSSPSEAPKKNVLKLLPLDLRAVFRVVALQVVKNNGYGVYSKKDIDITRSDLDLNDLETTIKHNLPANPLVYGDFTWQQITEKARKGEIPDVPRNFDLARFSQNISKRFDQLNYSAPSSQEVQSWMIGEVPKAKVG